MPRKRINNRNYHYRFIKAFFSSKEVFQSLENLFFYKITVDLMI